MGPADNGHVAPQSAQVEVPFEGVMEEFQGITASLVRDLAVTRTSNKVLQRQIAMLQQEIAALRAQTGASSDL